jgi:hypothetical protein
VLVLTIVIALTALLLLLTRFVQPELIYSVRKGLVMIGGNKAFIDKDAGRDNVDKRYKQLLVHDARYETRTYDEIFILQERIVKITELYRLLDPSRPLATPQKTKVCIVELAALLANLGRTIEEDPENNAPIVQAVALLKQIANGVRASQDEEPIQDDEEIDSWFIDNPITIEQVIELLIAAVVALAHRRQAAKGRSISQSTEHVDAWPEIRKLEKALRLLIRTRLRGKYQSEEAIYGRMRSHLGESTYNDSLQRMERVRKRLPDVTLDFFDYLYLGELETVIFKEWEPLFHPVFQEKVWLKTRLQKVIFVRNEEAHSRPVNEDERKVVVGYCSEIRQRMESHR